MKITRLLHVLGIHAVFVTLGAIAFTAFFNFAAPIPLASVSADPTPLGQWTGASTIQVTNWVTYDSEGIVHYVTKTFAAIPSNKYPKDVFPGQAIVLTDVAGPYFINTGRVGTFCFIDGLIVGPRPAVRKIPTYQAAHFAYIAQWATRSDGNCGSSIIDTTQPPQNGYLDSDNPAGDIPLQLTYQQSVAPIGNGHWTQANPAQIMVDQYQLTGGPLVKGELFNQSDLEGNVLTLTGKQPFSQCPADTLTVGSDAVPYTQALSANLTVYQLNPPTSCVDEPASGVASISLNKSYVDQYGVTSTPIPQSTGVCPINGTVIDWLLCPMYNLAISGVQQLNGAIQGALFIDTNALFGSSSGLSSASSPTGFQASYNVFRNVGLSVLIIAGLVMVVSQAAGLEIFSAYAIRKALPRIVIAAIGMALVWPLMQVVITFSNDLGSWVSSIILIPASVPTPPNTTGWAAAGQFVLSLITTVVAGGGILLFAGWGLTGGLSLLVTVLLGLLLGYIVLVIRQLVITICVLMAPLAIAASVLPGTERIWKLWRDTLLGALLMFPIIMGFISAGAAVSYITGQTARTTNNPALAVVAMIAYFAPYFMIPIAFRMTNGLMSNVFGMVNDRGKGMFDRLRKGREAQRAMNTQKLMAGSRFNPDSRLTKLLGGRVANRVGGHVGAGFRGRFGFGATGRVARANAAIMDAATAAKQDRNFASLVNNEEAMAAIALGNNREALEQLSYFRDDPEALERALAAGRTVQATPQMQTAALDALARSGKIVKNRQELSGMFDAISHGNGSMRAALQGNTRFTYRQVGRADLGRGNDYEALREMSMAEVGKQKASSLENLFAGETAQAANGTTQQRAPIVQAIRDSEARLLAADRRGDASAATGYDAEAQHFADILYAAQFNPYTSPEQQQRIARAIAAAPPARMARAQANYRAKSFGSGGVATPGAAAGGPAGSPPAATP